jgi:hypothetical protein
MRKTLGRNGNVGDAVEKVGGNLGDKSANQSFEIGEAHDDKKA